MWTRGKTEDGRFSYEVYGLDNELIASGVCDTAQEADRAAERAQRAVFFPVIDPDAPTIEDIFAEMDDDEMLATLRAELGA